MTLDPCLRRRAALLAVLGLATACSSQPPPPTAVLPEVQGSLVTLDPARQAILRTSSFLGSPRSLAGRPWEAAQIISELEFLAVDLRWNTRWAEFSPLVSQAFEQARPEWRGALGINGAAAPQDVIDAMTMVRSAYGSRNAAAAADALRPPLVTPGGQESLARLAALPPLPLSAQAARMAEMELWRMNRRGTPWSRD
ncbi:hypothetical protein GXW77_02980 [Roseomonas alkaliterrae]|uniref:Uncharacterized protein n=1 Tax=Neoroseomonas alkaliterrae TaxID=1452450 RepID=A0A840Y086_9PROT|nr:hypothetical protein [Neoroseomonas alkaliterrae]MBB5689827.1 hypothetical protein [Neoroseomonas alkaliterrae]MBR0675131.1 hypothetical protein [Neoroseomonas alkaliterrae]